MDDKEDVVVKIEFVTVFQKIDIIKDFLKFCLKNNYSANVVYALIDYENFLKKEALKNDK